nr:truncated ORF7b [Severe acute respiratory syndrome coronavirus 2]QPG83862.1 truncated ORF7b [Severe acute respiratory syndrome coronavirus 2]QRG21803.1 truncated ORF7b [Severe acute respiratory syndrome coronavirus 2]QRN47637.1 truncated ORF7b [Severe acute respiratory syndrome coronavirus 2]QRY20419.1 truncated ORF7b [Severe acute respiratory syndrome coronavirus 2]
MIELSLIDFYLCFSLSAIPCFNYAYYLLVLT